MYLSYIIFFSRCCTSSYVQLIPALSWPYAVYLTRWDSDSGFCCKTNIAVQHVMSWVIGSSEENVGSFTSIFEHQEQHHQLMSWSLVETGHPRPLTLLLYLLPFSSLSKLHLLQLNRADELSKQLWETHAQMYVSKCVCVWFLLEI